MGAAPDADPAPQRPAAGGPATWVVLLGTVTAAAVVVGGIVGYRAWRDRDPAAEPAAAPETTTESTAAEAPPESRLFTRTTATGIEIRVDSMSGQFEELGLAVENADGPPFCEVVDQLVAFVIDDESIVQGGLPITAEPPPELAPTAMWTGMADDDLFGVLVQVRDDAVVARLTASDGASDEMEPVDGVAALAIETGVLGDQRDQFGMPDFRDIALTVRYADGAGERAAGTRLATGPPVWMGDQQCFPGNVVGSTAPIDPEDDPFRVRLPPPGTEQPADPAQARADIEAVLDRLYGPVEPVDVLALVDDPFAMREMFERLDEADAGGHFDDAVVTVEDLVFLTAVEAAFDYAWENGDGTVFDERFGRARLVDGTWRVSRGMICRDLRDGFLVECPA